MITLIVAGILVWPCIKFLERKEKHPLDDSLIFGLVLAPVAMLWLISIVVNALGLSQFIVLLGMSLYFFVPTLMLRLIMEYPWKRACGYGGIVFGITFCVDITAGILFIA